MGNSDSKPEFERGDVIYCRLGSSIPGYHYGIYIDKETVIDFSQKGIAKKSLDEFSGSYEAYKEE